MGRFKAQPFEGKLQKAGGLGDPFQNLKASLLKVWKRLLSAPRACNHRICNLLARLWTILVGREPVADKLQRRRHVGNRILIEFNKQSRKISGINLKAFK